MARSDENLTRSSETFGPMLSSQEVRIHSGDPDPALISTSYVERDNLSMRMSMRRFTRLTNGFSKKAENHAGAVALYTQDVVLCNPFRPFARGPSEVAETIEQAASHYADGECEPERVTAFATAELGYTVEIERFTATVGGNEGSSALRVTTIFRLEEDGWRIAHRHADPITTPQPVASVLQG